MNSTSDSVQPGAEPAEATTAAAEAADLVPDPQLLEAHDLALAALREITPEATIGEPAGYRVEPDGVVSLRFSNRLAGYPGWYWTVSLARVEGEEPTVLEAELLPGEGALLAPDWVPWAVRLAEYQAAQAALAEAAREAGEDDVEDAEHAEDFDDVDDIDAADFDEDGSPILHAGDVDGVDIDEFADAAGDDADDAEDDESDDDEDDDESDDDEDDDESDDEDDDYDDDDESDDDDEDDEDDEDDD